jgi:hypothetical protein
MSSYQEALECAGANVLAFKEFGSYQGDWWARVVIDGRGGWINGSYGSCTVCDALQAEFGWGEDGCEDHPYDPEAACPACDDAKAAYQKRLADFGRTYLDDVLTQEQAVAKATENLDWDASAQEMVDFIQSHAMQA